MMDDMSIPEDMMWKKYKWRLIEEIIDSFKETEQKLEAARNKLYEALPSGEVDAFRLIKIIQIHIEELDKILEAS